MANFNSETNCYKCRHRYNIPGNCHIGCSKPDPDMIGNEHGIKNGWFVYPYCFDPIWKERVCNHFEPIRGDD